MPKESEPAKKPSETRVGQKWLTNFVDANDRKTAHFLIDELEIKDHSEILTNLRGELLHWHSKDFRKLPAVLIPIRSLEDLLGVPPGEHHIAYETFHPGAGYPALPGSEAEIGSIIRDMVSSYPEEFLSPETSIEDLREKKVRTFILLTDYCGSGKQASRFVDTLTKNRTIASWISSKKVGITVLSYASSLSGHKILSEKPNINIKTVTIARSTDLVSWSDSNRSKVIDLCKKYADSSNKNQAPLGYKSSFGLYLSNQRVPNNLPQILIRKDGDWPGLFPNRLVDPELFKELPNYEPFLSIEDALRCNNGAAVAEKSLFRTRPIPALHALFVLQLLSSGFRREKIYKMLKLDEQGAMEMNTTLISLGLIDLQGDITGDGSNELKRSGWKGYKPPKLSKLTHDYRNPIDYLPTQLR